MTAEEVQAIRERAAKATAGPWSLAPKPNDHEFVNRKLKLMIGHCSNTWLDECQHNPSFIAHARTDVPRLCDEVDRLRVENDGLHAGFDTQHAEIDRLRARESLWSQECTDSMVAAHEEADRLRAEIERIASLERICECDCIVCVALRAAKGRGA